MKSNRLIRKENLIFLVHSHGGSTSFASKIDKEPSQISQLVSQNSVRNVGEKLAREIELKLKLPTFWLDQDRSDFLKDEQLIPLGKTLKSEISSVNSILHEAENSKIDEDNKMLDEVLQKKMENINLDRNNAFWFEVKDDSMKPYLEPGTLTMIDKAKQNVEDGMRYALKIDGKIVVRRIYKEGNHFDICCDNKALKTQIRDKAVYDFNGDVQLIGKIVFVAMSVNS